MSRYQLTVVAIMAIFTYLPRFIPLTFYRKKITSPYLLSVLYYLPYAVLGALTFPGILNATPHMWESLFGGLACLFCAYREKGLVFFAIMGIVVSYITYLVLTII